MNSKKKYTDLIKIKAKEIGFDDCRIAKIDKFDNTTVSNYLNWINNNFSADMQYMKRNTEKRFDVTKLVDNAKSVIVVILNYYPQDKQNDKMLIMIMKLPKNIL